MKETEEEEKGIERRAGDYERRNDPQTLKVNFKDPRDLNKLLTDNEKARSTTTTTTVTTSAFDQTKEYQDESNIECVERLCQEYYCILDKNNTKPLNSNIIRLTAKPSSLNKEIYCCQLRKAASCFDNKEKDEKIIIDYIQNTPSTSSTYHHPANGKLSSRETDHNTRVERMDTLTQRNPISDDEDSYSKDNRINEIRKNIKRLMITEDGFCEIRDKKEKQDNIFYNNNIENRNHNSSVNCFDELGNRICVGDVNILPSSLKLVQQQHNMRDYTNDMSGQMFNTINPKCDHLPTISEQNDTESKNITNTDIVKTASTSSVSVINRNTWSVNYTNSASTSSNVSTNQAPQMESVPSIMDCVHREEDSTQLNRVDNGKVYVQQKIHRTVQQEKTCDDKNKSTKSNHINNTAHSNQFNCQGSSYNMHDNNNNVVVNNNNNNINVKNLNTVTIQYKKRWTSFPVKSS